jgi:hypothetical protein
LRGGATTGQAPRFQWKRALPQALIPPVLAVGYVFYKDGGSASLWKVAGATTAIWVLTAVPISYRARRPR